MTNCHFCDEVQADIYTMICLILMYQHVPSPMGSAASAKNDLWLNVSLMSQRYPGRILHVQNELGIQGWKTNQVKIQLKHFASLFPSPGYTD